MKQRIIVQNHVDVHFIDTVVTKPCSTNSNFHRIYVLCTAVHNN